MPNSERAVLALSHQRLLGERHAHPDARSSSPGTSYPGPERMGRLLPPRWLSRRRRWRYLVGGWMLMNGKLSFPQALAPARRRPRILRRHRYELSWGLDQFWRFLPSSRAPLPCGCLDGPPLTVSPRPSSNDPGAILSTARRRFRGRLSMTGPTLRAPALRVAGHGLSGLPKKEPALVNDGLLRPTGSRGGCCEGPSGPLLLHLPEAAVDELSGPVHALPDEPAVSSSSPPLPSLPVSSLPSQAPPTAAAQQCYGQPPAQGIPAPGPARCRRPAGISTVMVSSEAVSAFPSENDQPQAGARRREVFWKRGRVAYRPGAVGAPAVFPGVPAAVVARWQSPSKNSSVPFGAVSTAGRASEQSHLAAGSGPAPGPTRRWWRLTGRP